MVLSWVAVAMLLSAPSADTILPGKAPADIVETLAVANRHLAFVDECTDGHSHDLARDDYVLRSERFWQTDQNLYQIWSRPKDALLSDRPPERRARCSQANIRAALLSADASLLRAEQGFETATTALRSGVWMGPLHLCRDTVNDARVDRHADRPEDENWDGNDGHLSIGLKPAATEAYAAITRRHLGSLLAVRVAGDVVSRPRMNEPITEGRFYLTGPDIAVLEQAAAMAQEPC